MSNNEAFSRVSPPASMATAVGANPVPSSPPPVYVIASVKSFGWYSSVGWNGRSVGSNP